MMDWTTCRGRLYLLCRMRNSISGISIYFNYRHVPTALARVPLRLWLVFGARLPGLRYRSSTRKHNFISRFNWTSCIAPLLRGIGEPHGLLCVFGVSVTHRVQCIRDCVSTMLTRVRAHRLIHISGVPYLRIPCSLHDCTSRVTFLRKRIASPRGEPRRSRLGNFSIINFDRSLNYSSVAWNVRRYARACYLCTHRIALRTSMRIERTSFAEMLYVSRSPYRDAGLSAYRYIALVTHRWTKYFTSPLCRKNAYRSPLFLLLCDKAALIKYRSLSLSSFIDKHFVTLGNSLVPFMYNAVNV